MTERDLTTQRTDVGTVDELHASATKLTGLDDFGADDDNYREAWRCCSTRTDAKQA